MANVVTMPMPNDLRQMELKVQNGHDADDVPGIERLWLWRFKMREKEWEESERNFCCIRGGANGSHEHETPQPK